MGFTNIPEMFFKTAENFPEKTALLFKKNGMINSITWQEFSDRAKTISSFLIRIGTAPGEPIIILSENRPEWMYADMGILSSAAATVPIYPTLTPAQIEYIIKETESRVCFLSTVQQLEKIVQIKNRIPSLRFIITFEDISHSDPNFTNLRTILNEKPSNEMMIAIANRIFSIKGDDPFSIIYTSGTTGEPKGVILTHKNILSNIESSINQLPVRDDDLFLSFLPLSHVFERTCTYYGSIYKCATVAFAEDIEHVPQNLMEFKPTVMCAVPRFFEKFYERIHAYLKEKGVFSRIIFNISISIADKIWRIKNSGKKIPLLLSLAGKVADTLVLKKIRLAFGGRIRFVISGGAPLPNKIAEFFLAAGIPIIEGYGLTETSPVVSVNPIDKIKIGSVGKPIPGVEVKIAEDGEIIVRGPNLMKGYFKKPEATMEAIRDGWFHTGDIGYIDHEGYLYITDRKKELLVTSGGKKVAPRAIESMLMESPFIQTAMLIGDGRKFISALIIPNFKILERYARDNNIRFQNIKEIINDQKVRDLYSTIVEDVNKNLARYEKIKKFALLENEFSVESGELTPTMKIRKSFVEKNYKDIIEELYRE